jgi:hypothetical protein
MSTKSGPNKRRLSQVQESEQQRKLRDLREAFYNKSRTIAERDVLWLAAGRATRNYKDEFLRLASIQHIFGTATGCIANTFFIALKAFEEGRRDGNLPLFMRCEKTEPVSIRSESWVTAEVSECVFFLYNDKEVQAQIAVHLPIGDVAAIVAGYTTHAKLGWQKVRDLIVFGEGPEWSVGLETMTMACILDAFANIAIFQTRLVQCPDILEIPEGMQKDRCYCCETIGDLLAQIGAKGPSQAGLEKHLHNHNALLCGSSNQLVDKLIALRSFANV